MKSYIREQWFDLLVGFTSLVLSIYYLATENPLMGLGWFILATVWLLGSRIDYQEKRLKLLEEQSEKYDALVKKVDALAELLETERKYSDHLNKRIESIIKVVEDIKHGN